MLFKSATITAASGSVGGITASHNAGGMYFRARAIPTNPNSPAQVAVRNQISVLSNRWANVLTAAQRDAWDVYADNVAMTNKLGDTIFITGLNHFIRSNASRARQAFPVIDAAPTTFNLGSFTAMNFSLSEATQILTINFTTGDDWPQTDNYFAFLFLSRPQQSTINYFTGPYRGLRYLEGDTAIPLTTPQEIATFFPFVEGQNMFVRVNVAAADGRLSGSQFMSATAAA